MEQLLLLLLNKLLNLFLKIHVDNYINDAKFVLMFRKQRTDDEA